MLIPTDFLLSYSTLPFLAEVERQIEEKQQQAKRRRGETEKMQKERLKRRNLKRQTNEKLGVLFNLLDILN